MIGYLSQNHALIHAFKQPRQAATLRQAYFVSLRGLTPETRTLNMSVR